MNTTQTILSVITFLLSFSSLVISYFQFKEKGFLFNNSYLYASKEERSKMNKKPHYRQSAIAFLGIGVIFLILALDIIINESWLFYIMVALAFLVIIYAITSSIVIEKKYK